MPIHRTIKNVVKNHSLAEVKVREATSNDPWGPSTTLMSQIADLTYNGATFAEVMSMLWKRLNDHGKNWRHVYKSLVLLDYLLKTGSEQVVDHCRDNVHHIRTLRDFQHVEEGKDHGVGVRERAKQIVALLEDDARYRSEREKTLVARERYAQNTGIKVTNRTEIRQMPATTVGSHTPDANKKAPLFKSSKPLRPELEASRPSSVGEEDLQLQVALAMSREEREDLEKKQKTDLLKVQMAVEESRKALSSAAPKPRFSDLDSPPRLPPPVSASASNGPRPTSVADQQFSDPWNPRPNDPKPLAVTSTNDPWTPVSKSSDSKSSKVVVPGFPAPPGQTDPWGAPVLPSAAQQPSGSDSSTRVNDHNGAVDAVSFPAWSHPSPHDNVDDQFDELGSRFQSQLSFTQNSSTQNDSGTAPFRTFPWGVSDSAFSTTEAPKQRMMTKEEFFPTNINIIGASDLVSKPTFPLHQQQIVSNPFAVTSQVPHVELSLFHPLPSTLPPQYPAPMRMIAQPTLTATPVIVTPVLTLPPWQVVVPRGQLPPSNQAQQFNNSKNPFL